MPASFALKALSRSERILPTVPAGLARLAQNEEPGRAGGDTRSGGGLVKGAPKMRVAPPGGQDRIMIYGPKTDRTYIIEFRTAEASRW
jgi:hypothetical protein